MQTITLLWLWVCSFLIKGNKSNKKNKTIKTIYKFFSWDKYIYIYQVSEDK